MQRMSGRKLRRRSVNVTFAGDDEVLQHIVDAHNRKGKQSSTSRRKSCPESRVKTIEEEDEDYGEEDEKLLVKKSTALEDDSQFRGGEVYGFKTPKKSGQMAQLASESRTPKSILKTPTTKDDTPRKSVNFPSEKEEASTPRGKRTLCLRKLQASTPYRLHKRHGAVDSDSSDSMDASSSDSDGKEDWPLAAVTSKPLNSSTSIANTPASTSTTPLKSVKTPSAGTSLKRSHRKTEGIDMKTNVEEYFDIHGIDAGPTSDATLCKLDMPHLDHVSLNSLIQNVQSSHVKECKKLFDELKGMFRQWMYQMCNGFNILLYGFGSKRELIEEFRHTDLEGFSQLVVNGYFPSLTVKHILNSLTEEVIEHYGSFKSLLDQYEFIRNQFEKSGNDFYLIIHNIDGAMLRNEKSQNILSLLSQVPGFHVIASVDHINSSLIWDQTKCSRFRWLWYDATTFAPYIEETSYENSILMQQSGSLALSSLTHVMKSLTPNAKGIFLLLARYQLEHKDSTNYIGMSLQELYQRCRESFLVNSDLTLQAQLTEFRDHKMIRSKKSIDGVENLYIPIDEGTLKEFVDEHGED